MQAGWPAAEILDNVMAGESPVRSEEMSRTDGLNGQWIRKYIGTTTGDIHVNIDEDESNYRGVAYQFPDDLALPRAVAYFSTLNKERDFSFPTEMIHAIDPGTFNALPWENVKAKYPEGIRFSQHADIRGSFDKHSLTMSWTTDEGVTGSCVLPRSRADEPSEIVPQEHDWNSYGNYAIRFGIYGPTTPSDKTPNVFADQFHKDPERGQHAYCIHTQGYSRIVSPSQLKNEAMFPGLEIQEEVRAFLNLIQHHGYPNTLFLIQTHSHTKTAFFCFEFLNEQYENATPEAKVRIYVFDSAEWTRAWQPVALLIHPQLHVTVREFIGIENERMIPQQAASTVTSVDDMEKYIRSRETDKKKYLQAIDLPVRERKRVIRELGYMGITAGSLFPGLDGACEELRERNFVF